MQLLYQAINFLLYSNLFIALCAVALALTNQLVIDGAIKFDSNCLFIFFSTLFTYTYLKITSSAGKIYKTTHRDWAGGHKLLSRALLFISFLGSGFFFLQLAHRVQIIVISVALVTGFYGFIPIPFTHPKMKLRDLGLLKTIFVAIVWAVITVIVPLAGSHVGLIMMIFLLLRRFLFILALTMVFEIKDIRGDSFNQLITIPIAIGTKHTKFLAQGILLAMMFINTFQYFFFSLPFSNMLAFNLSLIVSMLCIQPVNENTPENWYYLVLDGMMVVQFIFVYLAARFF